MIADLSRLAVIILNYNCAELTMKCANQLKTFDESFHIVMVDNHSPDNSFDLLRQEYEGTGITVLDTGCNRGYSSGNNYGIQYAIENFGIEYFAIVNPDVFIPDVKVFEALINTIANDPKCAIIGASVINPGNIYVPAFSSWPIPSKKDFVCSRSIFAKNPFCGINKWTFQGENTVKAECVAGCFFLASVKIMREIGFLDEDLFMYNEEILLGYKVKQLGYHELVRIDQFYYHNHKKKESPTIKNYISGRKKRFQSDVTLYKKIYKGNLGLALMYLLEAINCAALFLWFLIKPLGIWERIK